MKSFLGAAAAILIACGGSTSDGDASTDGASDASTSDGPNLEGTYACGATTCQSGEYCVHPCCGGAPLQCLPVPDSGMCPSGTTYTPSCTGGGMQGPGCRMDPCKPPPPYCAAKTPCSTSSRDSLCVCG